jgi:hypothetical protein
MNTITVSFGTEFQIWQAAEIKDTTRPLLGYVQIHPAGLMLATDTHIAAVVPCTIEGAPADWSGILVPATFIKELLKNEKSALATFSIVDEEVIGVGKTGKFSAHTGQGALPQIARALKSALNTADDSEGIGKELVQFKSSLMDRLGMALGHDKGTFVPHQWCKPQSPVLVYGAKDSGAVGLLCPGAIDRATDASSHGRAAMQSIIARLTGTDCPVKQAA